MIAHVLHFSHTEILEMEFDELIMWFPVAAEINKTNGHQMVHNLLRGLSGGK